MIFRPAGDRFLGPSFDDIIQFLNDPVKRPNNAKGDHKGEDQRYKKDKA